VSRRRRAKPGTKLSKAMAIVSAMTTRGAQRATVVAAAVNRAGISTRTYRSARKRLGTVAVRRSRQYGRRGAGRWYAKRR
jgi:hypothetical protein